MALNPRFREVVRRVTAAAALALCAMQGVGADTPGRAVEMTIDARFRPPERPGRRDPLHLYLYLDGQPLTYLPADGARGEERLVFRARSLPGRHVIRLLLERHDPPPSGEGAWTHRTRVVPAPIEFEIDGEHGPWRIEIAWQDRSQVVSWSIWSGAVRRSGAEESLGGAGAWPALCDDLEAVRDDAGVHAPTWVARELRGCVRWGALWAPQLGVPSRAAVRDKLRRFGFRPIPRGARAGGG